MDLDFTVSIGAFELFNILNAESFFLRQSHRRVKPLSSFTL